MLTIIRRLKNTKKDQKYIYIMKRTNTEYLLMYQKS